MLRQYNKEQMELEENFLAHVIATRMDFWAEKLARYQKTNLFFFKSKNNLHQCLFSITGREMMTLMTHPILRLINDSWTVCRLQERFSSLARWLCYQSGCWGNQHFLDCATKDCVNYLARWLCYKVTSQDFEATTTFRTVCHQLKNHDNNI